MLYISNLAQSPPDSRDYKYSPSGAAPPECVDLMPCATEIEDQGAVQGSCTANATTSAVELIGKRAGINEDLSRQFNYYLSREDERRIGQDGAVLRDAINMGYKVGFCLEDEWPYLDAKRDIQPAALCYPSAATRKITRYEAVEIPTLQNGIGFWDGVANVKKALAEGLPVIIAMRVYRPIFSMKGPIKDQVYPIYGTNPEYVGNHAVTIIGYDDAISSFIFANSWGKEWGDGGFGRLEYRYLGEVFEAWVVRGYRDILIAPPEPVPVPPAPIPVPPAPEPEPVPPQPDPEPQPIPPPAKKSDLLPVIIGVLGAIAVLVLIFKG